MSDIVTTGSTGAAAASAAPSTPSSAPSAPSTPASATATPSATTPSASAPDTKGPIPFDRHEAILRGAYTERDAAQKALQEHQQKYGWADQFYQNPYGFVENWLDQLVGMPQFEQQVLAKAARMLQSRRGHAAATEEPQPDVPIVDGNGTVTGQTYSAAQLKKWREWDWQQKQAGLDQRLQPLEQMQKSLEQREVMAAIQHQSDQHATATLTKMRQQPWFKEHEAAIKQYFAANEHYGDNLAAATLDYFNEQVLPTIGRNAETKVLETLTTQAAGGTVSPSQSSATQKPKFKDFGEALRYYTDHPDEAAAMAQR